jgi:hypothetical protein
MSDRQVPFRFGVASPVRTMMFVDGENLAIRFKSAIGEAKPPGHVVHEPNIFVWSPHLNGDHRNFCDVVRKHLYTSLVCAHERINEIIDRLQDLGIESPRVFKQQGNKGSKQVDVSLAVEMLAHAHAKNYEVAILIAGDEDYVPLIEAVKATGRRVFLWALSDGLSPDLRRRADHYFCLDDLLLNSSPHVCLDRQ